MATGVVQCLLPGGQQTLLTSAPALNVSHSGCGRRGLSEFLKIGLTAPAVSNPGRTQGAFYLHNICAYCEPKTLAKSKQPPAAPFSTRCGDTLLLRQFRGEASVLDQILSLEKKVFAKKSSWTGQA